MIKNIFAAAAALGLVALSSSPSFATPIVHHISAVIDTAVTVPVTGSTATNIQLFPVISYSGFPFAMGDGDTIEINYSTIHGGISMVDAGPGLLEILAAVNLTTNSGYTPPGNIVTPSSPIVLTYDKTTTLSVTGYAGDLANSTITTSDVGLNQALTQFNSGIFGNITNSTVTLFNFTLSSTYTNVVYQPGYEYLAASNTMSGNNSFFITGDQAVPAPGALALLGLGLFGIGGMRRKAKTV